MVYYNRIPFLLSLFLCLTGTCPGQSVSTPAAAQESNPIRLNQLGFYPTGPKVAIVLTDQGGPFQLTTPDGKVVFSGTLSEARKNTISGKPARTADFSALKKHRYLRGDCAGIGSFLSVRNSAERAPRPGSGFSERVLLPAGNHGLTRKIRRAVASPRRAPG